MFIHLIFQICFHSYEIALNVWEVVKKRQVSAGQEFFNVCFHFWESRFNGRDILRSCWQKEISQKPTLFHKYHKKLFHKYHKTLFHKYHKQKLFHKYHKQNADPEESKSLVRSSRLLHECDLFSSPPPPYIKKRIFS